MYIANLHVDALFHAFSYLFGFYHYILIEGWIQVILAGKKESVSSALQKAERFRTELLRRGVLLVPVIWGEDRTPQVEKKGFGVSTKAATALPSIGVKYKFLTYCRLLAIQG